MKESGEMMITTIGTGLITTFLGGWNKALEIMLIVMAIDYITGISAAFLKHELKSSTGYEGILKKGSMFLVVILAAQVDKLTGNNSGLFRTCAAFFFIANETLSIIENAKRIGIEFPAFIEKYASWLKKTNNDIPNDLEKYIESKTMDEDVKDEKEGAEKDIEPPHAD